MGDDSLALNEVDTSDISFTLPLLSDEKAKKAQEEKLAQRFYQLEGTLLSRYNYKL